MAGPARSIDFVPLSDVLPRELRAVELGLRRPAIELERHSAAGNRIGWHWYPEHSEPPPPSSRAYQLLVDATITLLDGDHDWLELSLDIAWCPALTVNAAVEVACWCPQDHGMHQVREACWPAATGAGLVDGFTAGAAMLIEVLDSGRFDPRPWRREAGLPDAPAAPL